MNKAKGKEAGYFLFCLAVLLTCCLSSCLLFLPVAVIILPDKVLEENSAKRFPSAFARFIVQLLIIISMDAAR